MLQSLHVKNLALIDEAEVEFHEGLNILTGETGAGKSMIIGSVNLAIGGRYNADMIRKGANYGLVELVFDVQKEQEIQKLKALEVYPEDGMVALTRKLLDGRSLSRINGETVSIAKMREVAGILIDIHGQHEHQSLLYKKKHLQLLDQFARKKQTDVKESLKEHYRSFRHYKKLMEEANIDESRRKKEIDFLQFEIQEIEAANLIPGEDEQLESAYQKMLHGRKLLQGMQEAHQYTGSETAGSASDLIGRAIHVLQEVTAYDETIQRLYEQLVEVDNLLGDFNRELSAYSETMEFSEEAFFETEHRLNILNHFKSKYGDSIEAILAYQKQQEGKLEQLQNYEVYVAELQKEKDQAEELLAKDCRKLTAIRKSEAKELAKRMEEAIRDLNFLEVSFSIDVRELSDYTEDGKDEVEFMISLNPGERMRPLGEVASGGELSRIMLAMKSVLADQDEIDTLVFDEIDTGISGRTAQKVSEKLAVIGKSHQVICITHLAQIAAMADAHYQIEKAVVDGSTCTGITKLTKEASVEELARILGGAKITDTVWKNAKEMKKLADSLKKGQ